MNKVILTGRLAQDPEPRYTTTGIAVTKFPLAVQQSFKNKETGERGVDFVNIVVWKKLAEVVAKNLQKGRKILVEGSITVHSYDDKQGVRRKATDVIANNIEFLDYAKESIETN